MAVLQKETGPEDRQHIPRLLLHGKFLLRHGFSGRALLFLLRRLRSCHSHPPTDRLHQLEQQRVAAGSHGQGAGEGVFVCTCVRVWMSVQDIIQCH